MITLKRLRLENFKLLRRVDLTFPRRGSVLVEGLNESGKSTLFESVFYALYGVPLVTEGRGGRGTPESAIRYGEDSMSVELVAEVDETELEIRRSARRGRPTQARLAVRRPGAPEEQVTGVLAVNARIVEELGGLDGEALLNSCFVEQKKLSKLEDLAPAQRKDSLRKLLNLDRLTALAERFRVTAQDERALAEAKNRLDLARVASELPAVLAERAALEETLRGAAGRGPGSGREGGAPASRRSPGVGSWLPDSWDRPDPVRGRRDGSGGLPFPSQGMELSPTPSSGEDAWQATAARLTRVRKAAADARRTALLWMAAAAGLLCVVAALVLVGLPAVSWGLPFVLVMLLLAWRSYASAGDRRKEAARLEAELSACRDSMLARSGELDAVKRRTEEALGVEASGLDVEQCRREVERLAREVAVKRKAAELVEGAMERIVRMVLPNTERNLGQILPLLTAGRYHEARIGEDYQVQVWDDSAGRYVSKGIFSGGAKDQFSLALRLAFALATLPEELGTTPGFIFLDEPLSSFDGPRTEALIRLLTEGQIAENFSQIFVISHNRLFDANAFQYRLLLRDGRVVESNLPAEL